MLKLFCTSICFVSLLMPCSAEEKPLAAPVEKPNILLLLTEDWSLDLGCYGNHDLQTPHIDAFAASGRKYLYAYATAPVCSPSRSA